MNTWIESLPQDKLQAWIDKNLDAVQERYYLTADSDPYFAVWLHYTDRACRRRAMLGIMDLEDCDYWSMYEGGMTPTEAALEALEYNGFPMEEE